MKAVNVVLKKNKWTIYWQSSIQAIYFSINFLILIFEDKLFNKFSKNVFCPRSSLESLTVWYVLCSSTTTCFQSLCAYDKQTLAVSTLSLPVRINSKYAAFWILRSNYVKNLISDSALFIFQYKKWNRRKSADLFVTILFHIISSTLANKNFDRLFLCDTHCY